MQGMFSFTKNKSRHIYFSVLFEVKLLYFFTYIVWRYVSTEKIKQIYPGPIVYLLKEKICSPASFPSNLSFQASNKSWLEKSLCSSAVTTKILFFKTVAALRLIYYSALRTLTIE